MVAFFMPTCSSSIYSMVAWKRHGMSSVPLWHA